ncbi:hypothetical protein ACF0H5_009928 [Mactra antiquata]
MFEDDSRRKCFVIILSLIVCNVSAESGCSYRAKDGGFPDSRIAACRGLWFGHVKYGGELCAKGWDVCNWKTDELVLSKISWNVAMSVDGCYAYNAAQDGGRCRECREQLDQDDLAGIGRECPHQNKGQSSCISGGRIDASCCVDSHISLNKGCKQQPWIDGVLCCKQSGQRPYIMAPPPERIDVYTGHIVMLSCHAEGTPPPRYQWYKDGSKIDSSYYSRVSVMSNGDLLITMARRSDTGQYSCEVINEEGIDVAHTQVFVKAYDSGCLDKSTEALGVHKYIHACSGEWKGHVKFGSTLCSPGWHVCSTDDSELLNDITWMDILDTKGCYAYNVANEKRGKCRRCRTGKSKMAGIGRDCGRVQYNRGSCLSQGRIDVFTKRQIVPKEKSCSYMEGTTSGVVCCKRKKSRKSKNKNKDKNEIRRHDTSTPHCSLGCENGGQCVGYNVCMCRVGYKGAMCQNAHCPGGCGSRAKCVTPGKCECIYPFTGKDCSEKTPRTSSCKSSCLNGGRCRKGKCKCTPLFYGSSCQHSNSFTDMLLSQMNRTE